MRLCKAIKVKDKTIKELIDGKVTLAKELAETHEKINLSDGALVEVLTAE